MILQRSVKCKHLRILQATCSISTRAFSQISHTGQVVPDGFCSGAAVQAPSAFMHHFTQPGTYYYRRFVLILKMFCFLNLIETFVSICLCNQTFRRLLICSSALFHASVDFRCWIVISSHYYRIILRDGTRCIFVFCRLRYAGSVSMLP